MRFAARALAAAAVLWAASLPLAAYAASQSSGRSPSSFFALAMYTIGSVICHQRPERSFHLWAAQLPVCARCLGIYAGGAIGAVAALTVRLSAEPPHSGAATNPPSALAGLPASRRIMIVLVAALPAIITLVYEWLSGTAPSNTMRAATGCILGMVTAWLVVQETLR